MMNRVGALPRNIQPRFRSPIPIHNNNHFNFSQPNGGLQPLMASTARFGRPGTPNIPLRTINNELSRLDRSIHERLDINNNDWFNTGNNTTQLPVPQPVTSPIIDIRNPLGLEIPSQPIDSSDNQSMPNFLQTNSYNSRTDVDETYKIIILKFVSNRKILKIIYSLPMITFTIEKLFTI